MKKGKFTPAQKKLLKKIGGRIKKYRKLANLSQAEFGYKIDMDKPHISRAEAGEHNFSILTAQRFTDGLEIPLNKLFED
jgi:transcriptional regulator with XRE-family HTH domain